MDIRLAPKLAMRNKDNLKVTKECVCYFCYKVFSFEEIKEWVDEDNTAICPYCSIDSVVPVNCEEDKNIEILTKIHEYWF